MLISRTHIEIFRNFLGLAILLIFTLAALLTCLSVPAAAQSKAPMGDATDIVRKAMANYQARELKAKEYKYVENDFISEKLSRGKLQDSELYEMIPLGTNFYRRHLAHNGQPLPPLEERNEQERLDRAIKRMEENFYQRVANPDVKIPDDNAPPGTPVDEVMFDSPFAYWQLDLQDLPNGFSFSSLGEEVSDGRKLYVVAGKPKEGVAWARRGLLDLQNFDVTLWIDEEALEIVKFEARANKKGVLARPLHATVNRQMFPGARGEAELDSANESTLWYMKGTVITREWKKVNDEVWLPSNLHVKGKKSHERDYPNGDHSSGTWEAEQQTLYTDYRKFRVSHRILPEPQTSDPSLQQQPQPPQ